MARAVVAFNFTAFLEKEKLKTSGTNFTEWYSNLRIILIAAKNQYVLDAPLGEPPYLWRPWMRLMPTSRVLMTTL